MRYNGQSIIPSSVILLTLFCLYYFLFTLRTYFDIFAKAGVLAKNYPNIYF